MNSGKLRHRIVIEFKQNEYNDYKELVDNWTEYASRWADVIPMSAKELQSNPQVKGFITHRIRIRYLEGLTRAMRIRYKNVYYNITEVLADRTDAKYQNLLCIEAQ